MLEQVRDFFKSPPQDRGIITELLKACNQIWWQLGLTGHPHEVAQAPVGLLPCPALLDITGQCPSVPTALRNSSSTSKRLRVQVQESRMVLSGKHSFALWSKFHLLNSENTGSYQFTDGSYSRNLLLDSYLESAMNFSKHQQWLKSETSPRKFYLYPGPFENVRNIASQFDRNEEVSIDVPGYLLYQCIIYTNVRTQILPLPGPQEFCIKGQSTDVCTGSYGCRQKKKKNSWPTVSKKVFLILSLANSLFPKHN